ncbi:NAD-dependent DNA ligase LigA [Porphyromonas sp.]|uniref:NAD-dependent DNA ligase LigA n=1 Tax=Porphyromonas sp. TaxID=1924944 RepID=UPI0026DAA463|nr:NAD-dependent DNA ligase LigA [Porphyromonas sp.]MDO4695667.1 NAD-dependent DNA ligase LigA [Porphyromonas sp.]MDO4771655.1 NAD-dependent DNA ligase LigA [Porphyromonas sp.]
MSLLYKQKIEELRGKLRQYEYEYYILNSPTISDVEYDMMMKDLESLEADFPEYYDSTSPTQRVGSDLTSGDRSVAHQFPMLSLSNTYTVGEVGEFYERITKEVGTGFSVVAEIKYDGVSISLIYEHGILVRAVTRGDGVRGDDVTASVRAIRSIPLRLRGENLPPLLEVRGEILLPWTEFNRINADREQRGEPLFANPRNAVAGTIKQLSPKVVSERKPEAIFYYLLSDRSTVLPDSHFERLSMMKEMGLRVSEHARLCRSLEDIQAYIDKWDIERRSLDVATDGIVLKVDDYRLHEQIGFTAKSPKWAIAFKYPAEAVCTKLLSVDYQVGRTGIITPVANLEGVHISGTTVRRASLHNADIIRELDLHIGDMVVVEKGGEIIPKITGVKHELRQSMESLPRVEMPVSCPACGIPLVKDEGEAGTYCPNDVSCPPQIVGRIEHFASRKAMDINIGPETINELYTRGFVKDVSDMYALSVEDIMTLPLFKEKSATKLYNSIQSSKDTPFAKVLYALGIKFVGETVARDLAKRVKNMEALKAMSEEELTQLDGIGPRIAKSLKDYFADERHLTLLAKLAQYGLHFSVPESDEVNTPLGSSLSGHVIVVSGVFSTIDREALKELIVRHGGKVGSGITSKTTLMVVGENVGPSKLQKAQALGTKILSEQDFFNTYDLK